MNRVTGGFLSGAAAGTVVGVIAMAMKMLGVCKLCLIALGGGVFHRHLMEKPIVKWILIGWVSHLIISCALGVAIAFMLTYLGKKWAVFKGAFLGAVVWFLLIGVLAPLAGYLPEEPEALDLFIVFLYHIIFGGLTAFFVERYVSTKLIR